MDDLVCHRLAEYEIMVEITVMSTINVIVT